MSPQDLNVAPLAVIGQGRAVTAASATGAEEVVATTIGVTAIDAGGQIQPIPTEFDVSYTGLAMSPDGTTATIVSRTVGAEVWKLAGTPTMVNRVDGAIEATLTSDNLSAIVATPTQVIYAPVNGDTPTTVISPPAGAQIVDSTATGTGSVVAAALRGDPAGADLTVYTSAAGAIPFDVFAEPGWEIARAEVSDAGHQVVVAVIPGDPFEGVLASVNVTSGAIGWQLDVGTSATDGAWDVGADGRTLIARDAAIQLIGLDGSVVSEQAIDPAIPVTSVVATQSGYAVGFADGSIRFTDLDVRTLGQFASVGAPLTSLQPLTAGVGAVAVDSLGVIRLFDGAGTLLSESSSFRASAVNDVDVSPDGASVAYGTTGGDAFVADIVGTAPPADLVHPEGNVESVAFSSDGSNLLTGVADRIDDMSFDDTVSLWNLDDGSRVFEAGGQGMVHGMATFQGIVEFSPPGDMFASTALDFSVSLRRADDGELIHTFPPSASAILTMAFSPSGDRLLTSPDAGTIQLWSTDTFELINEFAAPPGGYWSVAFMPDGDRLVVSDLTGAVSIVNVSDGMRVVAFDGTKSRTSDISLSPDGALAAAGTDGTEIRIWSTSTGHMLTDVSGHTAPVTSTKFTPDGSMLVSGSQDSTVRVWGLA